MKKKRNITIVVIVVCVLCLGGFIIQHFFSWPVDADQSSGDIQKSARFSRKSVTIVNPSNMQELLIADESFKRNIVTAFAVMQSRVKQFNTLVNMSMDVVGKNPSFGRIMADMKTAKPMLENVNSSMNIAGSDLNAVLGGENRNQLAQNTNNAALAYTTLQKQNKLADQFIQTTDEYLKKASGNEDRLKLVRDQWLEYQLVTSALNKDKKAQKKLEDKGYLLSSEQAALTLKEFGVEEMKFLSETTFVDGLILEEQAGDDQRGVCIRFDNLGGLLEEVGNRGLLEEVGNRGLLEEAGNRGLLEEAGNRGLLEEAGNRGLLEEAGNRGLLEEVGNRGLLEEVGNRGLLEEVGLSGLFGYEGGGLQLEEAFGKALESFGYGETGIGVLSEISQGGLLEEVDLGSLFQEIEQGGLLEELNTGGFGQ